MNWAAAGLVALVVGWVVTPASGSGWRTASREPVGLAPDPEDTPDAIVQIYAARTWGWRGRFAVHSWIAVKPTNAPAYTVYEVIGWRRYSGLSVLVSHQRIADGRWFGAEPELIFERRGEGVDALIEKIDAAAQSYRYADAYTVWPGPNSNTFTAHVVRSVPELDADLPPTAIGKDYLPEGFFAAAPSGTGFQVSLYGLAGLLLAWEEGVEVNILGLVFGLDVKDLAIKLPLVGRIGPSNR